MCNYVYKELSCQHHYHIVDAWCVKYIETQRRCRPTIVKKIYCGDDICASCRDRKKPKRHPWTKMIRRPIRKLPTFRLTGYPYQIPV